MTSANIMLSARDDIYFTTIRMTSLYYRKPLILLTAPWFPSHTFSLLRLRLAVFCDVQLIMSRK